uniref:Uncharacterized protein n=1 Tax=Tanacetum cinerariifolium TaxID=118510 RepID=A0A6L2J3R1_TANCI|nr:hypothetical protein [Tanacetum cinerariifolium]
MPLVSTSGLMTLWDSSFILFSLPCISHGSTATEITTPTQIQLIMIKFYIPKRKSKVRWFANHFDPLSPIFTDRERIQVLVSDLGLLGVFYAIKLLVAAKGFAWVNYINAHATSTLVGDLVEVNAVKKSMIGHCLGAAGGLEEIATVKAIQTGWLHPSINQFIPEPAVEFDTVANIKQQHEINVEAVSQRLEIDANSDFMVTYNSDNDIVDVCDDLKVNDFMKYVVKSSRIVTLCVVESSEMVGNHQIRIYRGKEIMTDMNARFKIDISYSQAWRAKCYALKLLRGTPEESFVELHLYCHNLKLKNQRTITHIETDDDDRFEIFFLPSIHIFVLHMRPLIMIDSAHLKGEFLGTMYLAVAMDGNNQIMPLAYRVGKSKIFRSWDWFLRKLKECIIGKQDHLTIISDEAARVHFPGMRYNYMTSNSAESVNALSRHSRKLPICMMIDWFIKSLQQWYFEHRQTADEHKHELTPWAEAKLAQRIAKSATWTIREGGHNGEMSTQEYVRKITEEASEDDHFTRGPWLSAVQYLAAEGSITTVTLKDLSGVISGTIHYKFLNDEVYGNAISVEAVLILRNISVFSPKLSGHYLNITLKNIIKVFHKDTSAVNSVYGASTSMESYWAKEI